MNDIIETALSALSIQEIKDKISDFESLDPHLQYEDALEKIMNVILFEVGELKVSAFKSEAREYKEGGIFYRVRKLKREILVLKYSDFWEAPKEVIKRGRLNRPMEQLLYISPKEYCTPINETHIKEGDPFLLIAYKAISPINVFGVGVGGNFEGGFTPETEKKLDIISDFIKRNFLKNSDTAYILSNVIGQEICKFDYDGWVYPSVAHEGGENLCLKLSSKDKLEIQSAYLCELVDKKVKFTHAIRVVNEIHIFNDWDSNDSDARKILDGLKGFNKHSGSEIETRNDIGYPINIITP
ncbi:hypothetical protein [Cellvibrio japonicus]|nr:hypothetical protein [Cellvibrio japonicus]QEI11472.1 hypothetical protein FY117_03985 [Cellvibrio japonicus]QEI15046.1 hypothetical protein FY116_03985 [Cellvibrio japonicus]QEI18626.1 hypothetical protein FY115_03985 [Cellvibrio japonicus]